MWFSVFLTDFKYIFLALEAVLEAGIGQRPSVMVLFNETGEPKRCRTHLSQMSLVRRRETIINEVYGGFTQTSDVGSTTQEVHFIFAMH